MLPVRWYLYARSGGTAVGRSVDPGCSFVRFDFAIASISSNRHMELASKFRWCHGRPWCLLGSSYCRSSTHML